MSEQANPLKRLLLWLSGAPAEPEMAASPALPAEPADRAAEATPDPASDSTQPALPAETAPAADSQVVDHETTGTLQPLQPAGIDEQPEEPTMSNEPINDAAAYGVTIVPAKVPEGATYWRAVRVHHLTPEENQGRHHIFLDALDEAGSRVFGAQERVTWPGGEQIITVEKPIGKPGVNFPMWKWQICAVEMLGLPGDRIENLHTAHPDEPPGLNNTLFHHSFEVVYQRAVKGAPELPNDEKIMERYILFGPPASHRTAVYLDLARSLLLAQQPTLGYSIDEASLARHVVIVGEVQDISQESEDALRLAGCQVQRVQGTPEQIAAAFKTASAG